MKKLVKGICLLGVVALVATSCNKQETTAKVYRGVNFDETFVVETGNGFDGGRVYIDDNYRVSFEEGDLAMFFNVDDADAANSQAALYKVTTAGNNPEFEPNQSDVTIDDEMMDAKYAFYPGQNVDKDQLANENRAIFKLDPVQNYRAGKISKDALYMAAKIDNADNDVFAFRNICGVLVMKFYSPSGKTVENIAITDNNLNLTGDVTLKVNKVDPAELMDFFRNFDSATAAEIAALKDDLGYSVDVSGNTVTLDGINTTLGTTAADAETFYFVLRPLACMNGFDMVITFDDATTKTISTTRDNRIKPNTLRVFPALSVD